MHSAADPVKSLKPRTQLQAFVHTATEVIHAHSWDLTFSYKIALASHQFILHKNPNLISLQGCLFIVHLLQNYGLKPWAPRTLNLGFKPWVYYKRRFLLNPDTPKTILSHNSADKLPQKLWSYQS